MEGYINIHTHQQSKDGLSVINRYEQYELAANGATCSLGLHPWYVTNDSLGEQLKSLRKWTTLPNVIAVGECGLDKVTNTEWEVQEQAFIAQVELANELQKPLIIHCVRAYEEVVQLLEEYKVQVPVVFHGFNKSLYLAERLVSAGYYLSFGAALLNESSNAVKVIGNIEPDRIFLETDDKDIPISRIYETAAILLKTDTDTLILQLQNNFKYFFKI